METTCTSWRLVSSTVSKSKTLANKRFPKATEETKLLTYNPGDSFGELSLLYNTKRAATVKAKTDCVLWMLDRQTFNYIVKDSAVRKRERYEKFLSGIKLL